MFFTEQLPSFDFPFYDFTIDVNHLTPRLDIAVRLFSNRSKITSKSVKNKEEAHEPQASVLLMFLPHFGVFCDLLLNRPTATWNLFFYTMIRKEKRQINLPCLEPLDCSRICASLAIFKSLTLLLASSSCFFFLYLTCNQFLRKAFLSNCQELALSPFFHFSSL